jgi:hypothetical protein
MRLVVTFLAALCLLLAGVLAYATWLAYSYKRERDALLYERDQGIRRLEDAHRHLTDQWRQLGERQRQLERQLERQAKRPSGGK